MQIMAAQSKEVKRGLSDFKEIAAEIMDRMDLKEVVITYEEGKVVHVNLVENIRQKDLYERITDIFQGLTGPKFYGKLRLQCKNGKVDSARLEKNIKL